MSTTIENPEELRRYESAVYERDLIHELGRRLALIWDYDRYIANARGRPELLEFYRTVNAQEQANLARLKVLVKHYVSTDEDSGDHQGLT